MLTRDANCFVLASYIAKLPTVAVCVLTVLSKYNSFSSLLSLPTILKLTAGEMEDNDGELEHFFVQKLFICVPSTDKIRNMVRNRSPLWLVAFRIPNHNSENRIQNLIKI